MIDTLEFARQKFPGSQNSLDALCKRFNIDNSKGRKTYRACRLPFTKKVYINLLDQKEPKFNFHNNEYNELNFKKKNEEIERKIIKLSEKS